MNQRGVSTADVVNAAVTATEASYQKDAQNFRVSGGVDCDGDGLTLVVDIYSDLVIVTVF